MSDPEDQENLMAFFKNQKKGKKNTKNPSKKTETKANQEIEKEEATSKEPQKKNQNDDSADSDEENRQIVLDGGSKIKSIKEVKAAENEEEKHSNDKSGWAGFERKTNNEEKPQEEKKKPQSKPGEINFMKGRPPTFNRKGKGVGIMGEEFPELGDLGTGSKGAKGSEASKANSSTIGQFGAMAQDQGGSQQETRKQATKPMFTGKAKLKTGQQQDEVHARQNYDFSSMNMAPATSKSNKPKEGEEGYQENQGGERRQNRNQGKPPKDDSDDDFELVTSTKKRKTRQDDDSDSDSPKGMSFAGKPQFSKGGKRGGFQRRETE